MVLDARVDAAAIDSNTLYQFLEEHHELKSELQVLHSIGPLPIPPLLVNSRLPSEWQWFNQRQKTQVREHNLMQKLHIFLYIEHIRTVTFNKNTHS